MPTNKERLEFLKTNYPQQYSVVSGALGVSSPTTKPPTTIQPAVQQQTQPQVQQTQPSGFNDQVYNQYYAGWGRAEAEADYKATGGSKVPSAGGGGGISTPQTINLPELYKSLYDSKGVSKLEADYSAKEKSYNEAMSKINDNPFLSEASRVGRQQKLTIDFNNATASLLKDIATRKADIETQLNLETKQFDINSQVATNALNQLNSLLSMGALDNASGETIANLTRSTGISSDMINSAVQANKAKNTKTQVITSTADSGEVTISVVNTDTGEIIKQSSLGRIGNAQNGSGGSTIKEMKPIFIDALTKASNSYGHVTPQDWGGALNSWVARGGSASDFIANFNQFTDPNRGDFETAYGFKKSDRGMTTMSTTDQLLTQLVNK